MHADAAIATTPSYGLAAAASEVRRQRRLWEEHARRYAHLHRALACIDSVLALIEERNLDDIQGVDRVVRQRLRALEREVGVTPPERLLRVRTIARAHSLLLDWQQELIGELSAQGSLAATFVASDDEKGWAGAERA